MTLLWVAFGGAAGSVARYLIAGGVNTRVAPWGTVLVNIVGSFMLGYLIGRWGWSDPTPQRTGLTVGLLGGFTTFSTFSIDAVLLWERGQGGTAMVMVLVSVVLGLGAAVAGIGLGRA